MIKIVKVQVVYKNLERMETLLRDTVIQARIGLLTEKNAKKLMSYKRLGFATIVKHHSVPNISDSIHYIREHEDFKKIGVQALVYEKVGNKWQLKFGYLGKEAHKNWKVFSKTVVNKI
ncbi:MAG: hypothetical protein ACRC5M_03595 [Anaeroplasmataceae bacterium]